MRTVVIDEKVHGRGHARVGSHRGCGSRGAPVLRNGGIVAQRARPRASGSAVDRPISFRRRRSGHSLTVSLSTDYFFFPFSKRRICKRFPKNSDTSSNIFVRIFRFWVPELSGLFVISDNPSRYLKQQAIGIQAKSIWIFGLKNFRTIS